MHFFSFLKIFFSHWIDYYCQICLRYVLLLFFCLCGRRQIRTTISLQLAPFWLVNLPFKLFVFNKGMKTFINTGALEKPDCTKENVALVLMHRAVSLLVVAAGWYQPAHRPSGFFSISQRWFDIPTQPVSRHYIFLHILLSFMLWFTLFNILNRRKHFSNV